MMPHRRIGSLRKAAFAVAAWIPFVGCGAAYATDCNQDIGALTKKRQGVIDGLNKLAQGGKKQLDPIASCPKLRALVAVEHELLAYLQRTKIGARVPTKLSKKFWRAPANPVRSPIKPAPSRRR